MDKGEKFTMGRYTEQTEPLGVNIIPGQTWGTYKFPSGEVVKIQELSDQVYYDSEIIPIAVGPGTEYRMCVSGTFIAAGVGAKVPRHDFNLPEWGRVPVGWLYRVQMVGFHLLAGTLFTTLRDVTNDTYMQFFTGGQTIEKEGLAYYYPSGGGLGGAVALDGGVVANEVSALNIGSPSVASTVPMRYPVDLPEQVSFQVNLFFPIGLALAPDPLMIARYGAVLGPTLGAHLYTDLRIIRYRIVR